MQLSDLKTGETGIVQKVRGRSAFRRRIIEMGFINGNKIKVIKNAPLQDPIEYALLDYRVSLRRSEAKLIEVIQSEHSLVIGNKTENGNGTKISTRDHSAPGNKKKNIYIVFVGNPNAGKTSVYNFATRSKEHTGNYAGVTVDSKTSKILLNGYELDVTDLPGTYSLSAFSPEELFVREFITEKIPDVVVNVVDASNLERNLYLTTQLIDMDVKVIIALNMYDEVQKRNDKIDITLLSDLLGIPIIPTVGSKGKGVSELMNGVISIYNGNQTSDRNIQINYGTEMEASIESIRELINSKENNSIIKNISSRFLAVKLLERDTHILSYLKDTPNMEKIIDTAEKELRRLELLFGDDIIAVVAEKRYGFINGALLETYRKNRNEKTTTSTILDNILTNKFLGFPFFILFMWIMFTATFKAGEYPNMWLQKTFEYAGIMISGFMPDGSLKDLLINGIIGGVGGVIVFLPNILILFLFISFMEDSGYMARAVFIMDRLMHKMGLHGKSFIPLIMGFGCNVPAIMATRLIEDRNNRLLTILINPLMSCSARLPVYLLLIGAVFPSNQGSILFLLYLTGIVFAVVLAILFRKTIFKSKSMPFVMELPPYRMPTMRSVFKHMWGKASQYLKKMGGVILFASIIIWALGYFPRYKEEPTPVISSSASEIKRAVFTESAKVSAHNAAEKQLEYSYIGRLGKFIGPAIRPLGFDWKMGVSLITGIAAKEIVVSTLGVLHHVDVHDQDGKNRIADKIRNDQYLSGPMKGKLIYNPLSTISFLVFILIYFPCIAVFAAIRKESGDIRWALFTIIYTTILAYIISMAVYQLGSIIIL